MKKRAQLAGQSGGAEAPEVPADDHAPLPPAEGDHPGPTGPVATVLLIDLDADLAAAGAGRA